MICDVLVVGSGGAALRAALEACNTLESCGKKAKVVIATKGRLGKSGVTANSCSDRMAFHATLPYTEPQASDNWTYHAHDIYEIGGRVSDADLAITLAKGSGEAYEYLRRLGVPFAVDEKGMALQFVTDGSAYARACYTGPHTANHIEEALVEAVRARMQEKGDIECLEDCMVARLITDGRGWIRGAVAAIDGEQLLSIAAGSVILATGGAGEAFKVSVFPEGMTGDGYALAYRAGAELVNMEFIQIGLSSVMTKLACSGSVMRCIPRFINDQGEEFLRKYFPEDTDWVELYTTVFDKGATWPVSREHKTHLIDVAVYKEMMEGRTVFLDFSANPQGFVWSAMPPNVTERYEREKKEEQGQGLRESSPLARLLEINRPSVEWLAARGIDLTRGDKIELAPAIQHFQGGVKIGPDGRTTLTGLYACGEVAGGQHGANRPGGNALMDSQVMGAISGHSAALWSLTYPAEDTTNLTCSELAEFLCTSDTLGVPSKEARTTIQRVCYASAGVVRTGERLDQGMKELLSLASQGVRADAAGLVHALETCNILTLGLIVLASAIARPESRGPHLMFERWEDMEAMGRKDPDMQQYIIVKSPTSEEVNTAIGETRPVVKLKSPVSWDEAMTWSRRCE